MDMNTSIKGKENNDIIEGVNKGSEMTILMEIGRENSMG